MLSCDGNSNATLRSIGWDGNVHRSEQVVRCRLSESETYKSLGARAMKTKSAGYSLVGLVASPEKGAAVARDSGAAVGTSVNRKHPLSVKARNNSRSPSDDLFSGADAKRTALIAAPRVPAVVSTYTNMQQWWTKCAYRVLPRPSSLSVRRAREWESPQAASRTLPEEAHQVRGD